MGGVMGRVGDGRGDGECGWEGMTGNLLHSLS